MANDIAFGKHIKETLKLAIPVSLGQIGHMFANISDTAMLGWYHADHLGASAFAFNVFAPVMVFCMGLSMGLTPLVATALAKKDTDKVISLYYHGLKLYTVVGMLLFLLLLVLYAFLDNMKQEPIIATLAQPYFLWIAASIIPIAIFQHLKQYVEGFSNTRLPMMVGLTTNVINIVLNYFFIFGFGFIPALGIVGAGVTTFVSRCLLVVFMYYFLQKNSTHRIIIQNSKQVPFSWKTIMDLLKISVPIGIQLCFEVASFTVSSVMVGAMSKTYLSAHEIAVRYAGISYLASSGIGAAATIRISYFAGTRNYAELKKAAFASLSIVLVFMFSSALCFYFFRNELPYLMVNSSEKEIIACASQFLIFVALFQIADGIQVTGMGILRGMQDVRFPTFIAFTAYWIIALPLAYYLGFIKNLGPNGVWYALIVGLCASAVFLMWRFFGSLDPTNKYYFEQRK